MQQEKLFYDTWRSSLKHACLAIGGGKLAPVAVRLWPALAGQPGKAEAKLANCLNPHHDWKLDIEEIETLMRWAREEGVHCAMHQLADSLHYERPEITAPLTERQKIAEKRLRLAQQQKELADEEAALERAEFEARVRAVR